jgi:hypothetical protein
MLVTWPNGVVGLHRSFSKEDKQRKKEFKNFFRKIHEPGAVGDISNAGTTFRRETFRKKSSEFPVDAQLFQKIEFKRRFWQVQVVSVIVNKVVTLMPVRRKSIILKRISVFLTSWQPCLTFLSKTVLRRSRPEGRHSIYVYANNA